MSRWLTLVLTATSTVALTALAAPVAAPTATTSDTGFSSVAGTQIYTKVGNWCC